MGVTSVWRRSAIGETDSETRGLGRGSLNTPAYTSCSFSFSPAKLLSLRVQIHMLVGQPCTTRTGVPGATLDQLMTYDLGTSVASEPVFKLHRPWMLSSERTSLLTPLPFEPPSERTSLLSLPFAPPLLPSYERTCLLTTVALGPIAQRLTSAGPRLTGLGYVQPQPVLCPYCLIGIIRQSLTYQSWLVTFVASRVNLSYACAAPPVFLFT